MFCNGFFRVLIQIDRQSFDVEVSGQTEVWLQNLQIQNKFTPDEI